MWSWTPARVAKHIRCPDTVVLTAREQGRLVGFAIMHFGDVNAHLNLLGVRPSHQRRGIGRGLVAWLEQSARVAGIATVNLEVRVSNKAARGFYKSLNYWEVVSIPNYYQRHESAMLMMHDLHVPCSS
jgi:ribosomal-protein-alanine N-acetyltransferase